MTAASHPYFKHQKEIELSGGKTSDIAFQAMEELQTLIDNAIIQERRNLFLKKIPLLKNYRDKMDLEPFCNREIPELLNYFQQAIYLTSNIVYDHSKNGEEDRQFDFKIIELLSTYCRKWQKHERQTNNISTSNLSTINQIRVATNKVIMTYQTWTEDTIFRPVMMGRVEKQKKMYQVIADTLLFATHYERHLIAEKSISLSKKMLFR